MARYLLAQGCNFRNVHGELMHAVKSGAAFKVLEMLVGCGAEPNWIRPVSCVFVGLYRWLLVCDIGWLR